jgi:DNA polymerase IIIc chi subunit
LVQEILKGYLRRLTNLSGNNRSLLMLRMGAEQFIDVHEFDFALGNPSFHIIQQLIAKKDKVSLCPKLDAREKSGNLLSRKLKKLNRIDHFVYAERGAKDLYLGWPFLRGKFMDGTPVRCPLMFFPVEIIESTNNWELQLRKDTNFSLNKSFLQAYAFFNGTKLNEELLERTFDDFDKDSMSFRTSLYELFKESGIEINFNRDNFNDQLEYFKPYAKEQFENEQHEGVLKLFPEAVLGIFPQAGSYLVPDYVALLENQEFSSLEDFFAKRTVDIEELSADLHSDSFRFLSKVKEEQTFTPFKVDAFQENAIKAIKKGNSAVVQGPPGTGKSQLICNLIADYIARGKNVLVVCQKKAALDVVYKRMKEVDLHPFVALMHDFKDDRRSTYEQIEMQIERIEDYESKNNSLDTIQIERQFLQLSRRIDTLSEELDEFREALYDEKECGVSVKELYLTSVPDPSAISIKLEYRDIKISGKAEFERVLRSYTRYAVQFLDDDYVLGGRKSFANFGISEFNEIKRCLNEIPAFQSNISTKTEELTGQPILIHEAELILEKAPKINEFLAILRDKTVLQYFRHLVDIDFEPDPLWIANMERLMLQCYKGAGIELSLKASELGRFQETLERALKARKRLGSWIKWELFSKDKVFITRVLVANGLKNDKQSFDELIAKIDNRLNFEHNLSKIKAQKWIDSFPDGYKKIDVENWFYFQKQAVSAKIIYSSLRSFKAILPVTRLFYEELKSLFNEVIEVYKDISEKLQDWTRYLTISQINNVAASPVVSDQLQKQLTKDFDSLCEFDKIQESLSNAELTIIQKLYENVSQRQEAEVLQLFDNSLRLAWIDHIEAKYPILRAVSSNKLLEIEKELQEAVIQKIKISNEILILKAREHTYRNLEYNRLSNRVTYRDLLHQVTKKRRIWPIRKLIQSFPDEVFNLVPCWLASPESASAIFPMAEVFDLVIFDEASQCFAEKGIPAMYRGKQIVITGDDKQLQPNDLYKVRWEGENDDELPELEVDSLLDLAKKYLMQLHLRGHYRSRSLELITFSNQHFYNNKLRLLPDFEENPSDQRPIEYHKVDGIWENNVNKIEAEAVVKLVLELIQSNPTKEIGVITFNAKQQDLIMDVLEAEAASMEIALPEHLFVKNIENVQGDEKDIILFSTAYGPDKKGKVGVRFGSLNVSGGENRLNVAVTRAREKIIIVSSILPHELQVDDTQNEGPKLLKKYLQYAYDISMGKEQTFNQTVTKENPHWYLSERLKELAKGSFEGVEIAQSLPFADLTISVDGAARGLVLTDDQLYHDAVSVKDAHVYKPLTLSKKKWRFRGFFSRELWLDKELVTEKINKFITSLK